jgi:ABC-type multidrug transport system fused ATPase/permease subunit
MNQRCLLTGDAKIIVEYRGERERSSKMSQTDPTPVDPNQGISLAAAEEQNKQIMKAFGQLLERIAPWLLEFGSWIFGGLIAFTLFVMASLFTIGPVDPTIIVSTAAFAFALPLNVTGLFLLRLAKDLKNVGLEEEFAQALQDVDFNVGEQVASPKTLESLRRRRTEFFLAYSLGILALSVLLTLTGLIAVLWYMAWWIGVMFFVGVIISLVIVIVAFVTSQPPESPEEKERKRRYREELTRQAKEQKKRYREELTRQAKEQDQENEERA